MRHRMAGRHLGRDTSHRKALYRNLVTDLLRYERLTTTEAKAKEIRPMAERIISLAKRGDLHARRQALRFIYDPKVVKRTFDEIAPRMAGRPGGYLRITGLEARKGDGARMAVIELVDFVQSPPTPRPRRVTAAPVPQVAAGERARAVRVAPAAEPGRLAAEGAEVAAEIEPAGANTDAEESTDGGLPLDEPEAEEEPQG